MTNGNSQFLVRSVLGSGYRLDAQTIDNWAHGAKPDPEVDMWQMLHWDPGETVIGLWVGLVLLGMWYVLRRPARKAGMFWWVIALTCGGPEAFGASATIYVKFQNIASVTCPQFAIECTYSIPSAYITGPNPALAAGGVTGESAMSATVGDTLSTRQKDSLGNWGPWTTFGIAPSGGGHYTVYWTGNGTNLPVSGSVSNSQKGQLHVILQNGSTTNQTYQLYKDGVPLGTAVTVAPGQYLDVNYNDTMGNIEIRDAGGRVVFSAPNGSGYWTPNDDRMLVPPIWRPVDNGGTDSQNNTPSVGGFGSPTNTVVAGDIKRAAEIAHDDATRIINLLGNLATNRQPGSTNFSIDPRPDIGALSNNIPAQTEARGFTFYSNTLWQANNATNVGYGAGIALANSATGWMAAATGNWTNTPLTTVTGLTVNMAGFSWDLHPLHDSRWSSVWPTVLAVTKWVIAISFVYLSFLKFHEGMAQVMMVPQIQGSGQSGLGTNASLLTALIYLGVLFAMVAAFALIWATVWTFGSAVVSAGLSGAIGGNVAVIQAWSLMCELFPCEYFLAWLVTYWIFLASRTGGFALVATVIKALPA